MTSVVVYKRVKQLTEVILSNTANTTTTMYQILNFEKKEVDVLSVNSQQPILHQSLEDNEKREAFSKIMNVAKTGKTPTTYSTTILHRTSLLILLLAIIILCDEKYYRMSGILCVHIFI